jgi:fructosamine-3-kinase
MPVPRDLPGGLRVHRASPLAGGDIASVWRCELEDGRTVVVKRGPTDATIEAEGLQALAAAGGPTPEVLAVDARTLVLRFVSGPGDLHRLGQALATVHATTGARFGWHRDGVIGPLPQPNPPRDDWPTFVWEARLAPLLQVLPAEVARRLEDAHARGRLADELDHGRHRRWSTVTCGRATSSATRG